MNETIKTRLIIYLITIIALLASLFSFVSANIKYNSPFTNDPNYNQPELENSGSIWSVRSVDVDLISKQESPAASKEDIRNQVTNLKAIGVNYIAVGTLYDENENMAMWADEIHSQGLHVWYKGSFAEWNGEAGKPPIMTKSKYLERTKWFILDNRNLFKEGDSFSFASTPEVVGVGMGEKLMTWSEYKKFILKGMYISGEAFKEIGLDGKIHTNWLPITEPVVLDKLDKKFVEKIGLISVDIFGNQSQTQGELENSSDYINEIEKSLDKIYSEWQTPILISKWGYQVYQKVDDEKQQGVIDAVFNLLKRKPYIIGVNYWTSSGGTTAILNKDENGNLNYRKSAETIKLYFDPSLPPLSTESAETIQN